MRTTDTRVRRAIAAVAAGRPVVVTDNAVTGDAVTGDAGDGAGHLVFAAAAATPKLLAFTIRHTSGYVRIAMPANACDRLALPPMCADAPADTGAGADRVTVDWCGTGTGISATDRAATIAALAAPESRASDFQRPGHVIPVRSGTGGVLRRPGPAEAAVDLARLARRSEAGALCDIVSRDRPSAMASAAEAVVFADDHGLAHVSIADLAAYRRRTEPQVLRIAETVMPTRSGDSRVVGYRDASGGSEHLAVIVGPADPGLALPLHVHVECLTGDVFGSVGCRCGVELDEARTLMAAGCGGVVLYLRPFASPRACGLYDSDSGTASEAISDTAAWILRDLGLYTIRLSEDAPALGLVMFGAIRGQGLSVESALAPCVLVG